MDRRDFIHGSATELSRGFKKEKGFCPPRAGNPNAALRCVDGIKSRSWLCFTLDGEAADVLDSVPESRAEILQPASSSSDDSCLPPR